MNILVPTDFSECADNALEYAASLSRVFQGELTLMHAYHVPIPVAEMSVTADPELGEQYRLELKGKLDQEVHELRHARQLHCNEKLVMAFAVDAVLDHVRNHPTDLVVMGTHGASGIRRLFGSNTASIIQKSEVPVLAVPQLFNEFSLRNIAVSTDLMANESIENLNIVRKLALAYQAEVHIIHVRTDEPNPDEPYEIRKLEEYFGEIPHHFHMIRNQDVEDGIFSYMDGHGIDLLVTMHRLQGFFQRLFQKSHTRSLTIHTSVPLLNIPVTTS